MVYLQLAMKVASMLSDQLHQSVEPVWQEMRNKSRHCYTVYVQFTDKSFEEILGGSCFVFYKSYQLTQTEAGGKFSKAPSFLNVRI